MNIKIKKENLVLLCSLSYCCYFMTNNVIFSIIPIILCLDVLKKSMHLILIFAFISIFFLFIDLFNTKDILILGISTTLFIYKFNDLNPIEVLYKNSIVILCMLFLFLFFPPKDASWFEVIKFEKRLAFDLFTGKYINPNPLGLVSAICLIGLFLKNKYFFCIIPFLFLLTTQSRASILLVLLFLIIYYVKSIKNVSIIILIFGCIYLALKDSLLFSRFQDIDDSGRAEHIAFYLDIFKENYLFGYSIIKLDEIYSNTKLAIDNMYISLFIRYGIFMGGLLISIYIFLFIRNFQKIDDFLRLRVAIFFSFLAYGLFEKGFLFTYMMWIPLSICFTNLKKSKV